MFRRLLCVICACLLMAVPLFSHAETHPETLTLMVYMCGSDLESNYFAATSDLLEMMDAGFDGKKIQLLVMTGGTEEWGSAIPTDSLPVYLIRSNGKRSSMVMVHAFEDMSMGGSDALSAFLSFGYEQYPANQYALIMWDHGGGSLDGLCIDTRHELDTLYMDELYTAFSVSPFSRRKLSWIGFDACLMATVETATILSPFAEYMIASQEREPGAGWNYAFLADLDPAMRGDQAGKLIIDAYFAEENISDHRTLSCTDLNKVLPLIRSIDGFFDDVRLDAGSFASRSRQLNTINRFGKALNPENDYDLIDLGSFLDTCDAKDSRALFSGAVVYTRSNYDGCTGLTIYHPNYNKTKFLHPRRETYRSFGLFPAYVSYTDQYGGYLLGSRAGDWDNLIPVKNPVTGHWELPLTPGQNTAAVSALLRLLRHDKGNDSYTCIASTVASVGQDACIASLPEKEISLADEQGNLLYSGLTAISSTSGEWIIFVNFIKDKALGTEEANRILLPGTLSGRAINVGDSTPVPFTAFPASVSTPAPDPHPDDNMTDILPAVLPELRSGTGSIPMQTAKDPSDAASGLHLPEEPVRHFETRSFTVHHGIPLSDFLEEQAVIEIDSIRAVALQQREKAPEIVHGYYLCSINEAAGTLQIRERFLYDEKTGDYTNRLPLETRGYDWLVFPSLSYRLPEEAADTLPDFDRWPRVSSGPLFTLAADRGWHFTMTPVGSSEDLSVLFSVTDIQNEIHSSFPVSLE